MPALAPDGCMLSGEAANTNITVIGLTQSGLKPTIYRTHGEQANHYTTDTDAVALCSGTELGQMRVVPAAMICVLDI